MIILYDHTFVMFFITDLREHNHMAGQDYSGWHHKANA